MLPRRRVLGGLWGALVGDALGVPVEGVSRQRLLSDPVRDMLGYGAHNQPTGTWSDDSSLLLCTVESLLQGFDTIDLAHRFLRWYMDGHWTPWGRAFDIGNTTRQAVVRITRGVPAEEAGGSGENDNGNGSLMRILPIALRFATASSAELLQYAHRASAVTHRHPRSQMACGLYCLMAAALLKGATPDEAYQQGIALARASYREEPHSRELPHFGRLLSGHLAETPEAEIRSSGYVIDTLEASLWCLLNSSSFEEAVLKAVNLGGDTDTTGTVAGGLAGTYYGLETIPVHWLNQLARKEDISQLFDQFVSKLRLPH